MVDEQKEWAHLFCLMKNVKEYYYCGKQIVKQENN